MLISPIALLVLSLGAPGHGADGGAARPAVVPAAATRPAPVLAGAAASATEAAQAARQQTGGRVLAVQRVGGGWQVKVLTPAGEVRVVFIPAASG